ncbi:MAG: transposase [Verrucomicrobia bacterium]|nr:transposase [Verrucomicrobiota bacterium]
MILEEVFELFAADSPACVMLRATLANVFAADRLNAIFDENAQRQRQNELLFSSVADIMGGVVCRIRPSVNAAYQAKKDELSVSVRAVYDKLRRTEPAVVRSLVVDTAIHMGAIIEQMTATVPPLLPGYRVKIVDGNHLRRTDRRIGELREMNVAPLPGKALAILDPRLRLVIDVIPCEDGHAQERRLFPELVKTIERGDVFIADRNFCTRQFLLAFFCNKAFFIIRQHGSFSAELSGRRRRVGKIETGTVYEQEMSVCDDDGNVRVIRRITVKLNEPTRDGDTEMHILTNLPKKVGARKIAQLYRDRWTIETAFQEMAENLRGEIKTLGYPKAALFGFCMALVSYNILSVVKAAIRSAHGADRADNLSTYYMADEIAGTYRGMMIVLEPAYWEERFANLTPRQMAKELIRIAKTIPQSKYRKNKWSPKKKKAKKTVTRRKHISTQRILDQRKHAKQAA